MPQKPRVLHKDPHVIAVHKPAGWVVYPEPGDSAPSAKDWAEKRVNRKIHPVHRLDKDTSGILIFALDPPTAADLIRDFSRQKVKKTYLAWVEGDHPSEAAYRTPLAKKGKKPEPALTLCRKVYVDDPDSESDALDDEHWEVEGEEDDESGPKADRLPGPPRTLLEINPKTGRYHQIRRHLAQAKFPIVGDRVYGPGARRSKGGGKQSSPGLRLCLCAVGLEFTHPRTKQRLNIRTKAEFLRLVTSRR